MKLPNKLLTFVLCGALATTRAMAVDDCANIKYAQNHPERCRYNSSDDNSWLYWGGGAVTAGGIVAFVAMMGGGSSGGGDTAPAQYMRTLGPTIITRRGTAPDFTGVDLSSITETREYKRNTNAYNDIQLAYSIARGYTGAGTTIAVFDTDLNIPFSHGAAVAEIAQGPIAPNAVVEHHTIASDSHNFKSYNEIGNIINATTGANVYNNSWNVSAITADKITSRTQFVAQTSATFVNSIAAAATQKDTIMVWAAGNDGGTQSGMLSAAPRVIPELNGHFVNVVAWDSKTQTLADYSNACGITMNYCITAPGTIKTNDGYIHVGTSFAAPVVSAAIAVLREAWPYLSTTEITDILFTTAADLGDAGIDEIYGHGMLDLESATRPVGELSIAAANGTTQPLATANVSPEIAHAIESASPTMAFFDAYGRAYETRISDNVVAKNRGLGFERLRGDSRANINVGNIEFGFYNSNIFNGTGFLGTDGVASTSYVATNQSVNLGGIEIFARTQFGTTHPTASAESIITNFSNIYTASAALGLRGDEGSFSVGAPETIVYGNMNLHAATGRNINGELTYYDYKIDMASKPAVEYRANYRFLTTGFVDNPYGKNEFYVFAKTKLNF